MRRIHTGASQFSAGADRNSIVIVADLAEDPSILILSVGYTRSVTDLYIKPCLSKSEDSLLSQIPPTTWLQSYRTYMGYHRLQLRPGTCDGGTCALAR